MEDNKKVIKYAVAIVAALLSVYLLVISVKEAKSIAYVGLGESSQNTITVSGEGDAVAIPDIATFTFGVTQESPDARDAQTKATKIINDAYSFLGKNGVDKKDIKNTSYNINPVYDYIQGLCTATRCTPGKQTLRGYEVSQMIEVKLRKTDDAGKILAGIGETGVTNVGGLNFTLDNEDAVKNEARAEAITKAKAKADTLANELGVRLGRIISFNENGSSPIYYSAKAANLMSDQSGATAASAPVVPVGEQKITSNVTIVFEIK